MYPDRIEQGVPRIIIYIDVQKAMQEDIAFYITPQGHIMSPGDENGILGPHLFHTVERLWKRVDLVEGWQEDSRLESR